MRGRTVKADLNGLTNGSAKGTRVAGQNLKALLHFEPAAARPPAAHPKRAAAHSPTDQAGAPDRDDAPKVLRRPRRPPKPFPLFDDDDEREADEGIDDGPPDFVESEYQRRAGDKVDGEFCPDWVIKVTDTKAELLVLAKIAHWFAETREGKLKVKTELNGRWWLYKTYAELARDLRGMLTADAIRGAVRSLEKRRILITNYDSARSPPKLYRIDPVTVGNIVVAVDRVAAGRKTKRRLAVGL